MRDSSAHRRDYESLKQQTDPTKRGYAFQSFIAEIFRSRHFKVVENPRAAKPRQVDLFATLVEEMYLIETKWRRDPANVNDIDSLFTRLEAVPTSTTGILVSNSGFTPEVLKRVALKSHHPVLLVSGSELESTLGSSGDFIELLHRKKKALLVNREVLLDVELQNRARTPRVRVDELPSSTTEFLFPNGHREKWISSVGQFGKFSFVTDLPDIDWVAAGGFGVTVDIVVPIWEQNDFFRLLLQLTEMGWVTEQGSWSIQQATVNWHGFGARALGEALQNWNQRYEGLETHHTEEVCYFDVIDDGYYTLTASISAEKKRIVRQVELSFQLVGIPLDLKPLHELCASIGVRDPVHFRPKSERSVSRGRFEQEGIMPSIKTPVAYVIAPPESHIPGDSEWVVGIVVENPFCVGHRDERTKVPTWVPDMLRDSQYLVCSLRSWHSVENLKTSYELWEIESAWTSDALIVHPVADWPYEPDKRTTPPAL